MKVKLSVDLPIWSIRNHNVMLDADLARLYGATTKRFNEAFKRNRPRFPDEFAFQLTAEEFAGLRSQIATSNPKADGDRKDGRNWCGHLPSMAR